MVEVSSPGTAQPEERRSPAHGCHDRRPLDRAREHSDMYTIRPIIWLPNPLPSTLQQRLRVFANPIVLQPQLLQFGALRHNLGQLQRTSIAELVGEVQHLQSVTACELLRQCICARAADTVMGEV